MTPFELGKQAAQKQAILPALWAGAKAVLPYAAMMFGPQLLDKFMGGGAAQPAQPAAPGENPFTSGPYAMHGAERLARARAQYDPNAQFGGFSPAVGKWMKGQQMQQGMNKHFFQQLHAPKW